MDKSLEKQLGHWLKQQKNACGIYLNLSVLFGLISALALVMQAYLVAKVLNGVIMESQPATHFNQELITLAILILVRSVLVFGREKLSFQAGLLLRQEIRKAVLNKLERLGPAFIKGKPVGSWVSIVLEQVEDLQDFYSRYLPQMTLAAVIPLIILVAVFPLNWAGGLILLLTAPLIPLFMILVGWGAADANRKNFAVLSRLSGYFMDRLQGLSTLKLFFKEAKEIENIAQASEEFRSRTMTVLRIAFLSSAVLEFFAAVSIAVLAVYFGFSYLGHLDFGHYNAPISLFTGMFVLILAPEFYQPLRDMGTHYHAKAQAIGAAESLMALLTHPEPDLQGKIRVNQPFEIEAKDLFVLSMDGKPLLGPISFSLKPRQHIALVGPSGAGKTSLLNALLGFLPTKGKLTINGEDINVLDKAVFRHQLAWLGQDPQLFNASVRDNVALGNPELTDTQIHTLLHRAGISDFSGQNPSSNNHGLDYLIGEQGQGVSVGQAQRIALARALAQDSAIFLLDEPTASLDSHSEQIVQRALGQAIKDKSCLIITHRLDQLETMDDIWVLDKGQIVQHGNFAELSQNPGLFAQMLAQRQEQAVDIETPSEEAL